MVISIIHFYNPLSRSYEYSPYLIDIRWYDTRYKMYNVNLWGEKWGIYKDYSYTDFHPKRIARERDLYCSVIDCAM